MKQSSKNKLISVSIFFAFFICTPLVGLAANQNMSNLYNNPNQTNIKNPYKFTAAQVLKSGVIQQVIGCTGVVNKVAGWMVGFVQSPAKQAEITAQKADDIINQYKEACKAIKGGGESTVGSIINTTLVKALDTTFEKFCAEKTEAEIKPEQQRTLVKTYEEQRNDNIKEQCLDGIAMTLAKNQLTSMTRSVMNWANTGYGGNPFYVQNINTLNNNIQKNIYQDSVGVFTNGRAYPYGNDFSRSLIKSYNSGWAKYGSGNFLDSLTSDLSYFLNDDYSNTGTYGIGGTTDSTIDTSDLQRAQRANDRFANDFSVGGWEGWLALTQRDQNNPLGFTILASQYLANKSDQEITNKKNEVIQNNGFLSQKKCIKWDVYDENGKPKISQKYINWQKDSFNSRLMGPVSTMPEVTETTTIKPVKCYKPSGDCCAEWQTTTPGSLIKEKVTTYLNSPERQLELADTINESLNALFSVLISKLEEGGLYGLSDSTVSVNWTDNVNSFTSVDDYSYSNGGAYGNFNLTKNLGNTYIHGDVYSLGTWNASANITDPKNSIAPDLKPRGLYPNVPPITEDELKIYNKRNKKEIPSIANLYYTVSVAGKTPVIDGGYNSWEKGDRVFWDGSSWQNWKCKEGASGKCTDQVSPIKNRGVIQIQKDYILAAKEILTMLPGIMTNIGELDYCIPGPNPSYKTNSTNAQSAYQDWIGSLYVGPKDEYRIDMHIDQPGDRTFDNWKSIYNDNPRVWDYLYGKPYTDNSFGWVAEFLLTKFNTYHFDKNGNYPKGEAQNMENHKKWMDLYVDYTSNHLFQNFYETFDDMMDRMYFKNFTKKYKEYENRRSNDNDLNPAYIPMAESGLSITSNIMYYNDETEKNIKEYTQAIEQAKTNIAKLEIIKLDVSRIIKAAQERRDDELLKKINENMKKAEELCKATEVECVNDTENTIKCKDEYDICISNAVKNTGGYMTINEYKKKYQECFDEEDVQFFDVEDISNTNIVNEERCENNFDDDLDGLVDSKDPDCGEEVSVNNYKCLSTYSHDVHSYSTDLDCSDGKCNGTLLPTKYSPMPCEARTGEALCGATEKIVSGPRYHPNWFDPYNEYTVNKCVWGNVLTKGSCVATNKRKTNSYLSDGECGDGKCVGNLIPTHYTPMRCESRGPNDCTSTDSIYSGPKYHLNWFDPYNEYEVATCKWSDN